MGIARVILLI